MVTSFWGVEGNSDSSCPQNLRADSPLQSNCRAVLITRALIPKGLSKPAILAAGPRTFGGVLLRSFSHQCAQGVPVSSSINFIEQVFCRDTILAFAKSNPT